MFVCFWRNYSLTILFRDLLTFKQTLFPGFFGPFNCNFCKKNAESNTFLLKYAKVISVKLGGV